MKSPNLLYMPALDQIRLFAALGILFFHVLHNEFTSTWHFEIGVDLFFTLSGFLFFVIAENQTRPIHYGKFIYNRILRIYPLVTVLFFLTVVIMRNHFTALDYLNLLGLNFIDQGKILWFSGDYGYQYLSFNWWTVSVEFIFYLIFPFLFKFYRENGVTFLLKAILAIVLLRCGLYYIRVGEDGFKNLYIELNYSVFGHMDTFIVGMLCGYLQTNAEKLKSYFSHWLGLVLFMPCFATYLYYADSIDPLIFPTTSGIACGLFILFYLNTAKELSNRFSSFIAYLGSLSFSIYLLHSFVKEALEGAGISAWILEHLSVLLPISASNMPLVMVLTVYLPCTLAFSMLTFSTIEKPFLNMRARYFKEEAKTEGQVVQLQSTG